MSGHGFCRLAALRIAPATGMCVRSCAVACLVAASMAPASLLSQGEATRATTAFEGARLIVGDGGAPIENGVFVVAGGRITAVGAKGSVVPPAGASQVDLTGKTVMPAMINVHVHIGYEGYTSWGAGNYTPENVLDHLQREAFYGVAATQSVGSSPTDASLQFQRDQQAGKFPPAARFLFMPGMAPPNRGAAAGLLKSAHEPRDRDHISRPTAGDA